MTVLTNTSLSSTALSSTAMLLEHTLEFSLIALIALAAAAMLRNQSAALRHWVLASAVACAVAAPALGFVVPSWQLPLDAISPRAAVGPLSPSGGAAAEARHGMAESPRVDAAVPTFSATTARVAAGVWAVGAAINLAILLAGWWRLARVRSRSHAVRNEPWVSLTAAILRAYGVRRAVLLLQSNHPTLLVTWGILQPKVILPRGVQDWTDERMRVVLCHELAHVQRGDWIVQVAAELLRSIYWFNPLAWMICRQLRHESEHAADDVVLNVGIEGRDYAAHLLDVARVLRRQNDMWWPAPAIVRPSTLERRITAMLDTHLNRTPLTRSARVASVAALFCLAVAIASAQGALATFSGAVLDPMNRTLPNATLVLTNVQTKAKHEVRSDDTGRFEFSELPHGEYALEVKYPGFMALRGQISMTAQHVQQTLHLEVGTLQETVTVRAAPPSAADPQEARVREARRGPAAPRANDCNATPHGGNLRPPHKLYHVAPAYPVHLAAAGVAGTVLMDGVIAKDGTMKEVQVVRSTHPDLDASALAAVRQWRFDSTLLNCMPIEVLMKVTVNFTTN